MPASTLANANQTAFDLSISRVLMRPATWSGKRSPIRNTRSSGWAREVSPLLTSSRMPGPAARWRACLHQSGELQGQKYPDMWQGGVFQEIVPPERVVYTFAWEGEGGQPTRETLITITFTELEDDRTQMDFHQEFFDSVELRDGHNQGWNSSFDRMNDYVTEKFRISTGEKK